MAEDVQACQRIVEQREMEMLVLDQTRVEIGLPVAKVIVPGFAAAGHGLLPVGYMMFPSSLGGCPGLWPRRS